MNYTLFATPDRPTTQAIFAILHDWTNLQISTRIHFESDFKKIPKISRFYLLILMDSTQLNILQSYFTAVLYSVYRAVKNDAVTFCIFNDEAFSFVVWCLSGVVVTARDEQNVAR
jgi:hypothetical protein